MHVAGTCIKHEQLSEECMTAMLSLIPHNITVVLLNIL